MGREEFVKIIRSNVLRIEVDEKTEKLLKCLQREFRKYFRLANRFVKQYYQKNSRLPSAANVYRLLREYGVSSTAANEVSKKVLKLRKATLSLRKEGLRLSHRSSGIRL